MVDLAPLLGDDGTPTLEGLLDLWSLIYASYVGEEELLQGFLSDAGGGEIVQWQFDPNSNLVDFSLTRFGDHWVLAIAGTTSFVQWVGNVGGASALAYLGGDIYVHGWFNLMWQGIRDFVSAFAPLVNAQSRFTVAGHSLGGAVAQLAANELSRLYGGNRVELCAFAAPKALTAGYRGPQPGTYIRINRIGDPVPYLPPQFAVSLWTPYLDAVHWNLATAIHWYTYGQGYLITDGGSIVPDSRGFTGALPDLFTTERLNFEAHTADSWTDLFDSAEG